jgi:hypothetical protein
MTHPERPAFTPTAADHAPPWHAQSAEAVLQACATQSDGLSEAEAARRLQQHGPNRLAEAPPVPA